MVNVLEALSESVEESDGVRVSDDDLDMLTLPVEVKEIETEVEAEFVEELVIDGVLVTLEHGDTERVPDRDCVLMGVNDVDAVRQSEAVLEPDRLGLTDPDALRDTEGHADVLREMDGLDVGERVVVSFGVTLEEREEEMEAVTLREMDGEGEVDGLEESHAE